MSLPLNCTLLCASGAAYDINPATGQYTHDPVFSKAVAYSTDPTPISADQINACLVGQNASGIIVAFRGTLPPNEPDSYLDFYRICSWNPWRTKVCRAKCIRDFLTR
jgi:hypothetical protein